MGESSHFCTVHDNSIQSTPQYKWENTTSCSPRQRHDLLGTRRMHCKAKGEGTFNGFSAKDKQLGAFQFIFLNGLGARGTHQVSCQNFNKLSGLQGFS